MKDPHDCKRALATSAMIQLAVYIVGGVTCTALWGWNVADPITLQIPRSWVGYLLNVFVIVAVALDFAISGKIVNDYFASSFFRRNGLSIQNFGNSWCIQPLQASLVLSWPLPFPTFLLSLAS